MLGLWRLCLQKNDRDNMRQWRSIETDRGQKTTADIRLRSVVDTDGRPDGVVRSTPGLIRIEIGRDNSESVVWGKST